MGNDNKFWLCIWSILSTTVISIVISIAFFSMSYWKDHNSKIESMVNNGINPVAAMCALQDDYGKNPVCIVLATKSKESE